MSTYSPSLRIELPTDGTQAGTWGNTTNANMAFVMDSAIAGYQTVSVTSASQALTYTNGPSSTAASNQSVYAMLRFTTTTGAAFAVYAPPASKAYIIWNNSGQSMTLRVSDVIGSTTAISGNVALTIANGNKVLVWSDAVSFYELQAANLTGTLAIANGGTGQTTANAALNALLPSQGGNANKYLQTDGTNSSWDAISLSTADITGTLAVANGGTGATTASGARTNLGLVIGTDVPAPTGTGASGTWGISISGNAATATNGLTTGNYNSYAPTLTGTGASGTWNISISGNAATATSATTATTATNATDATTAQNTRFGPGNSTTNIANGNAAFAARTAGLNNTAMGNFALRILTTGSRNTAIGSQSMYDAVSTDDNVAVGYAALYRNVSGYANVAIGQGALASALGNNNTAVGYNSAATMQTGNNNTAIGWAALYLQDSATNCTAVGQGALPTLLASLSNASALGYDATVTGSNQIQLGNSATTTYVYGTVQNRSDLRDKTDVRDTTLGLDFVMSLRPVDYKWDMRDFYRPAGPLRPEDPTDEQAMADYEVAKAAWAEASKLANIQRDGSKKRNRYHHGFIAQEVMALNAEFGGIQDHKIAGGEDVLSLGYDEMVAPLVKAIQELKAEFDAYKASHP
jgi:hypothetical protein